MRIALALVLGTIFLAACNTVEGIGRDIKGAGEAVSDTAKKTKKKINE